MSENINNQKMGVNWKFLTSILYLWEKMYERQDILINSMSKASTNPKIAYAEFVSILYTCMFAVEGQFKLYLKRIDSPIKTEDYFELIATINVNQEKNDPIKALRLCRVLNLWAITEGVFKTLTDNVQPKDFEEAIEGE